MGLSQPRTIFGIHQFTPYYRTTGLPYGTIRVLKGSSIALNGEVITQSGGSSPYIWFANDGLITPELSIKPAEYPDFLMKLFLGKTPTETLADAGSVSTLTNVNGTTCLSATIGIASVSVESGEETELKFGKYVVKVVSATTVDVYGLANVDAQRGTELEYQDDDLKITASALTITTATPVTVPNTGVELTGGSGTIGMTIGDTAVFDIYPPSSVKETVRIGALGDYIPEFGALILAQKQGDGTMWMFDCFRIKAQGFPFGMEEKAYSEAEITGNIIYDSDKNGIMDYHYIKPSSGF